MLMFLKPLFSASTFKFGVWGGASEISHEALCFLEVALAKHIFQNSDPPLSELMLFPATTEDVSMGPYTVPFNWGVTEKD